MYFAFFKPRNFMETSSALCSLHIFIGVFVVNLNVRPFSSRLIWPFGNYPLIFKASFQVKLLWDKKP